MCEVSYVIDIMVTSAESPSSVTLWVSTPGNCIEFVTLGEAQSSSGSREEASYSSSSDDVGTLAELTFKERNIVPSQLVSRSFAPSLPPSPPPPSLSLRGSHPPWMGTRKQIMSRALVSHPLPSRVERRKEAVTQQLNYYDPGLFLFLGFWSC